MKIFQRRGCAQFCEICQMITCVEVGCHQVKGLVVSASDVKINSLSIWSEWFENHHTHRTQGSFPLYILANLEMQAS